MSINDHEIAWHVISETGSFGDAGITYWGPKEILVSGDLKEKVLEHFASDSRNATLSIGYDQDLRGNEPLRCLEPFGSYFFLNSNLFDLVGNVDQKENFKTEVIRWSKEATRRGLFHHWASWLDENTDVNIEISNSDLNEIMDSLTPLGSTMHKPTSSSLEILIDGSWLGKQETGSQRATVEIIRELQKVERVKSVSVFNLPSGFPAYAADLSGLSKVKEVQLENASYGDIIWRPYQPSGHVDFRKLNRYAKRVVITYLDLIAYGNKNYHKSEDSWLSYRSSLRLAAIQCDGIIAISNDVRREIIENMPLVDSARIYAIPLGTNHLSTYQNLTHDVRTIADCNLMSGSYILCLGTNFAHKNRDFAFSVVKEVRRRGLSLDLVFAGLILDSTNSGESQELLKQNHFPSWVKTLGSVGHEDRDWLLANASVSIYPTSAEGFGLVPFESAAMNVPLVATNFGPLSELLTGQYLVEGWSVNDYADAVIELIQKPDVRERSIRRTLKGSERLTWAKCANEIVDCFLDVASKERAPANIASNVFDALYNSAQEGFNVQVKAITSSFSWKITAPLRVLHKKLLGIRSKF